MKIPQTFTPERNLDNKIYRLLEGKEKKGSVEEEIGIEDFCQKNLQVCLDTLVVRAQVQTNPRYLPPWNSPNRLHVESVDNLVMHYDGHNGVYVKLTAPILRGVYEKKTNAPNMSDVTREEYVLARHKAYRKLIRLRERTIERYGFDSCNLIHKVKNDAELSFKLYTIFKDLPKGSYGVVFQEDGCNWVSGAGFTGADRIELYNFYNNNLVKHLPKNLEKGFWYNLKKGLRNIFRK